MPTLTACSHTPNAGIVTARGACATHEPPRTSIHSATGTRCPWCPWRREQAIISTKKGKGPSFQHIGSRGQMVDDPSPPPPSKGDFSAASNGRSRSQIHSSQGADVGTSSARMEDLASSTAVLAICTAAAGPTDQHSASAHTSLARNSGSTNTAMLTG